MNSPNIKNSALRIGITGSYGGLNLGDEAILHSILGQLRESLPDVKITVFSRNPEDTKKRHKVDRVIHVREASRDEIIPEIQSLDLLIFGGGGILFDAEVSLFLREVQLAHEYGVPVIVYAISAGPLKDPANHLIVREALNRAEMIIVRDRKASNLLQQIGIQKEIVVTADPAFLLKPEPVTKEMLQKEGLDKNQILVGMSVREPGAAAPDLDPEKYHAILANVADFIAERFEAQIIFIPMERAMQDLQHSHAVMAKMLRPEKASVLKGDYTSGQILTMMKYFKFAVGMRLHFLIFAAMQGVPFVALPYASKVHGLLEHFGMQMPPLEMVNPGRVIAHIDRLWDDRQALKEQITRVLPEAKQKAQLTHEMLMQFIQQKIGAEKTAGADKSAA